MGSDIWPGSSGGGSGGGNSVTAPITGDGSAGNPLAIAAATTSAAGSMSAADKAFLVNQFAWQQAAIQFLLGKVPALTKFEYVKLGIAGQGAPT